MSPNMSPNPNISVVSVVNNANNVSVVSANNANVVSVNETITSGKQVGFQVVS